jgi:hypothetical protein
MVAFFTLTNVHINEEIAMIRCVWLAALWIVVPTVAQAAEPQLAHMVFFTLADDNAQNRKQLVDACEKYLADHEGVAYFSAGTLAEDLKRDVNDQDYDVALHLVFQNKAAHDQYQTHPRHVKFIEENKPLWKKVRVFDSYIASP